MTRATRSSRAPRNGQHGRDRRDSYRDLVQAWGVRDGRVVFLKVFQSKAEALEAAGLDESATSQNIEVRLRGT